VHVNVTDLLLFLDGKLSGDRRDVVQGHLAECEFCREFLEGLQDTQVVGESDREPIPPPAMQLRDRIYNEALRGRVIPMTPMAPAAPPQEYLLAADGRPEERPAVECLREYFSESPEMVLRVMRSAPDRRQWVQLVTDDPRQAAHVLLRLPDIQKELLTDSAGRADLSDVADADIEALKWEVKLPDVSFTLDELAYDPDRTEYGGETVLESSRADRVRLRFEGKTEGKLVTLEFLNLVGIDEKDALRVYVIEGTEAHALEAPQAGRASFRLSGSPKSLSIRLFKA